VTRVACVQAPAILGDPAANLETVKEYLQALAEDGVDIVVFPECFLTGYVVSTEEEARRIALTATEAASEYEDVEEDAFYMSEEIAQLDALCEELDIVCVVGYAAETALGELVNECVLIEPGQFPAVYRKTHLPCLGFDNFAMTGDDLPVFETRYGRIGMAICYDLRIPETLRVLALKGADLVILPTNWPEGADFSADSVAPVRAMENKVFLATCNRCDEEGGFRFIGKSGIFGLNGEPLAKAGSEPEVIVANLNLPAARDKRNVNPVTGYATEVFAARQPDLYDVIVSGQELPTVPPELEDEDEA